MKFTVRAAATVVTAASVGVLASAIPAAAHVTVDPEEAESGSHAQVNFKVPNESDDASTVKLEVSLPENAPFASVQTKEVPGWKVETETRELDEPLDMHGREIDEVVSTITWTADSDDDGIQPDQFGEFPVSLGPLPDEGEQLVFKTVQTYSDDSESAWIDEPEKDGSEPEEPAPFITVSAAEDGEHATNTATTEEAGSGDMPVILSSVAAALGFIALVVAALAFRRSQMPGGQGGSENKS